MALPLAKDTWNKVFTCISQPVRQAQVVGTMCSTMVSKCQFCELHFLVWVSGVTSRGPIPNRSHCIRGLSWAILMIFHNIIPGIEKYCNIVSNFLDTHQHHEKQARSPILIGVHTHMHMTKIIYPCLISAKKYLTYDSSDKYQKWQAWHMTSLTCGWRNTHRCGGDQNHNVLMMKAIHIYVFFLCTVPAFVHHVFHEWQGNCNTTQMKPQWWVWNSTSNFGIQKNLQTLIDQKPTNFDKPKTYQLW